MSLKFRIIIYIVCGLTIPVLSQILFPREPLWEPLSFVGLLLVLVAAIEIGARKK